MRLDHLLSKEEEVRVVLLLSHQGSTERYKICEANLMASNCVFCSYSSSGVRKLFLVAMRLGDTPVPIPNTTVKTWAADDTILVTVWQNRWLPNLWGYSSVGRAPALQAGGQGFESLYLHWPWLKLIMVDEVARPWMSSGFNIGEDTVPWKLHIEYQMKYQDIRGISVNKLTFRLEITDNLRLKPDGFYRPCFRDEANYRTWIR